MKGHSFLSAESPPTIRESIWPCSFSCWRSLWDICSQWASSSWPASCCCGAVGFGCRGAVRGEMFALEGASNAKRKTYKKITTHYNDAHTEYTNMSVNTWKGLLFCNKMNLYRKVISKCAKSRQWWSSALSNTFELYLSPKYCWQVYNNVNTFASMKGNNSYGRVGAAFSLLSVSYSPTECVVTVSEEKQKISNKFIMVD